MNKRLNKTLLITISIMIACSSASAFAENDTDYAGPGIYADSIDTTSEKKYLTGNVYCKTTPNDFFIKCLTEKKTIRHGNNSFTPDEPACVKLINDAGEKSGVIEYEIFPKFNSKSELYDYALSNDDYKKTDNYKKLGSGDIIFYKDCPGIVIRENTALFADANNKIVSLDIDEMESFEAFIVEYPYFEKLANYYMKDELLYTRAKRCGILANMIAESNINPAAEENTLYRGFGVCQWTGERHDALLKYCKDNNLNEYSLYSQIKFMDHELQTDFAGLNNTLDHYTSPDEDGAYSAAFDFCDRFENPLSSDSAVDRGIISEDYLWPIYKNF